METRKTLHTFKKTLLQSFTTKARNSFLRHQRNQKQQTPHLCSCLVTQMLFLLLNWSCATAGERTNHQESFKVQTHVCSLYQFLSFLSQHVHRRHEQTVFFFSFFPFFCLMWVCDKGLANCDKLLLPLLWWLAPS